VNQYSQNQPEYLKSPFFPGNAEWETQCFKLQERDKQLYFYRERRKPAHAYHNGNVLSISHNEQMTKDMLILMLEFHSIEHKFVDIDELLRRVTDKYYSLGYKPMHPHQLPTEFFNHQIQEVDTACDTDLLKFVNEWGAPFSPMRARIFRDRFRLPPRIAESGITAENISGIELTSKIEKILAKEDPFHAIENRVISLAEVRSSLRFFQLLLKDMGEAILAIQDAPHEHFPVDGHDPCNWGDSLEMLVELESHLFSIGCFGLSRKTTYSDLATIRGLLTPAIASQIRSALVDPTPWRKCECEGCNRIFKYAQRKRVIYVDGQTGTPHRDARFCCDKCSNRQRGRNSRARNRR